MADPGHVSEDGLERLLLGTITYEAELAPLEEHLPVCPDYIARGGGTVQFVEAMRVALRWPCSTARSVGQFPRGRGASSGGARCGSDGVDRQETVTACLVY